MAERLFHTMEASAIFTLTVVHGTVEGDRYWYFGSLNAQRAVTK